MERLEGIVTDVGIAALAGTISEPTLPPIPWISRAADGTVSIEFTGTLESSPSLDGAYSPVAGASSPYTVDLSGDAMFYIAR